MSQKLELSSRMGEIAESATLKMNARAKELKDSGKNILNLTAGEPDFPILNPIKDAAKKAIDENHSKYTPVPGIPELRKGVAEKFKSENGLNYTQNDILVGVGAKQIIFNFLLATVSPGDEVIVPAPYWVSYPDMVKIAAGKPVIVDTTIEESFKITPEKLKKAITPKTKALILNSPSNPTGAIYTKAELQALEKVLEGTNVWVVSDEIYEKLTYEENATSFASLSSDAFERTLTVNGFSKAYAMTGWRLGYAGGPAHLIKAMSKLQGQSTSGANSVAQRAALVALSTPDSELKPMVSAFQNRRDQMIEIFSQCKEFSAFKPHGAFYLFLNIEGVFGKRYNVSKGDHSISGSSDFAMYLLEQAEVATVPGIGFGADKYIRLSFAVSDKDVQEGCKRITDAVQKLK